MTIQRALECTGRGEERDHLMLIGPSPTTP
jgi:hypothetical protein